MDPLHWVGLAVAAVCAGASMAGLLVVRRPFEIIMTGSAAAAVGAMSYASLLIITSTDRPLALLACITIAVGGIAGGFGLLSAALTAIRPCAHPQQSASPSQPHAVAVILLADVEHPTYCPGHVTAEIKDLLDAGVSEPGIGAAPFVYAAQKARYRAVGDWSPEHDHARALCERVDSLLDDEQFGRCALVSCGDGTVLAEAVEAAAARGHRSVVVATVHVAESFRVDREKIGVDARLPGMEGLSVAYTPPLWASGPLASLTAQRILAVTALPAETGVALVMHGQPGYRERTHSAFDVQENAFVNRVRLLLTEAGIPANSVRTCWQDWRAPDVSEAVRHIAALGCSRVIVSPACFPFENLTTLLDLPVAIRQARVPESVSVVHVSPWRDDEVFAEEIAAAVRAASLPAPA